MAAYVLYKWESDTYPAFQSRKVERHEQGVLLRKLSRHFKVDLPRLVYSRQRGANALQQASGAAGMYHASMWHGNCTIKLGKVTTLGTLVHEFAHHINWRRWKANGHGRTFKRELKRTYTFSRRYLVVAGVAVGGV